MERKLILLASVSGGLAVILGALGAHSLALKLEPRLLAIYETGVRYQMYHALALLAAAKMPRLTPKLLAISGWSFLSGTVLFSGSLYLLTLTGKYWLGAITPLGGLAFVFGWLCLARAAWKR